MPPASRSISRSSTTIRAPRGFLKLPSADLLWRRLSAGGNLLCRPEVIERLLGVIRSGSRDQFEIDSDERNLKLGATAFGDILSLTISDVTALKRREASFRLLFDNNPMPMWVFDAETTGFLSVNDAAVQHYGYSRATVSAHEAARDLAARMNGSAHTQALQQVGDTYQSGAQLAASEGRRQRDSGADLRAARRCSTAATAIWSPSSTSPNGARPRRGSPIWRITMA